MNFLIPCNENVADAIIDGLTAEQFYSLKIAYDGEGLLFNDIDIQQFDLILCFIAAGEDCLKESILEVKEQYLKARTFKLNQQALLR